MAENETSEGLAETLEKGGEGGETVVQQSVHVGECPPKKCPAKKKSNSKTRIITGGIMFAAYVLLFYLRACVSPLFFDAVLIALTLIGTIEMYHAFKKFVTLMLFYPLLPMLAIIYLNHRSDGFLLLILLFLTASFTDIFAYTVGSLLGKGRRKLAPVISPNKTYIGAFGGLLGGLTGAMLVWLLSDVLNLFSLTYILFNTNLKILFYIFAGLLLSIFTMAGDLFASYIKRKTGIKDYGKIFPGHGGVLDRFDGNMFAAVILAILIIAVKGV